MVVGGSQGSAAVNEAVRSALPKLLEDFQVVHLCGKDKVDNLLLTTNGYKQFEYIKSEMKDIFAMADLVISRAGANAICELLALHKPNILIPLSLEASRGDQILNANSFEKQGFSYVIKEEELTSDGLLEAISNVFENRDTYVKAMEESNQHDAVKKVVDIIEEVAIQE